MKIILPSVRMGAKDEYELCHGLWSIRYLRDIPNILPPAETCYLGHTDVFGFQKLQLLSDVLTFL